MHLNGPTLTEIQPAPSQHFRSRSSIVSDTGNQDENKNKRSKKGWNSAGGPNKRTKMAYGYGKETATTTTNPRLFSTDIAPLTQLPTSTEVHEGGALSNGIDTSTAHIKALTGENGAAVCLHAIEVALNESNRSSSKESTVSSLSGGSAENESLTAEGKAKQSRDRNRQHARNTRVRKKAYLEELKRTLNELVGERDRAECQKLHKERGLAEQKDVRYRVLEEFLRLRGQNEQDASKWELILEQEFCLRLPRTDVPGVVCSSGHMDTENANDRMCHSYPLGTTKKQLKGVTQVMEDSAMVTQLLQSLGNGGANSSYLTSPLSVFYQCDKNSFMMDGSNVVMSWMATSSGAVAKVCSLKLGSVCVFHTRST